MRVFREIVVAGQENGASFEEIAGRIETDVADRYEESFEDLSKLHLNPHAPSAALLDQLRRYAEARRDSSRAMVDELRSGRSPDKPPRVQ